MVSGQLHLRSHRLCCVGSLWAPPTLGADLAVLGVRDRRALPRGAGLTGTGAPAPALRAGLLGPEAASAIAGTSEREVGTASGWASARHIYVGYGPHPGPFWQMTGSSRAQSG